MANKGQNKDLSWDLLQSFNFGAFFLLKSSNFCTSSPHINKNLPIKRLAVIYV